MIDHGTVYCDGMPHPCGCPCQITPKREWATGEGRRSGWLVTHSEAPMILLHFCPSCAVIVLSQMAQEGI